MKRKEALKLMEQITDELEHAKAEREVLYWLGMADAVEYLLDTDPAFDEAYARMGQVMQDVLDWFGLMDWYKTAGPKY